MGYGRESSLNDGLRVVVLGGVLGGVRNEFRSMGAVHEHRLRARRRRESVSEIKSRNFIV